MRFRNLLLVSTALTGALALGTGVAAASTVTFTNTVNSTTGENSQIDGAFDISGFLSEQHNAGNAVNITGGTMHLYGYSSPSNTTYFQTNNSYSYLRSVTEYYNTNPHSCGFLGLDTCYDVASYTYYISVQEPATQYYTESGDFVADGMGVTFGNQYLPARVPEHTVPFAYTVDNLQVTGITGLDSGDASADTLLSLATLDDLKSDGVLSYALLVKLGHFDSLGLDLSVDYTLSPLIATTPVPPAGLLLGTGLALLGLIKLPRRQQAPSGSADT